VDEVVEKCLTAIGGRDALSKLTSRTSTGTVTVSTPAATLPGTVEIFAKSPNKSRAVIRLDLSSAGGTGVMTIEQLFDGARAFSLNTVQGDREITGLQLDNLRNNLFPSPLLDYKAAGLTLELLPHEQLNGRDAIVLRVTPKVGSVSRIFIDAETYLVARTVATIDTPANGPLEQTSDVSDYRLVDGVKVAFHVVNANPLQTLNITLSKVEHNLPIDDAMFGKK
jgi:hypothetical protein